MMKMIRIFFIEALQFVSSKLTLKLRLHDLKFQLNENCSEKVVEDRNCAQVVVPDFTAKSAELRGNDLYRASLAQADPGEDSWPHNSV